MFTNKAKAMNKEYYLLLQINDALFPIGGYTQSYALETYVQKAIISNAVTAKKFIQSELETAMIYSELLPAQLAYIYTKNNDLEKLEKLEAMSKAARSARELREASQKLGNRFVKTVLALQIDFDMDFFKNYTTRCKHIGLSYCIAYGVFCAVAGIKESLMLSTFLYSQTSGFVTNCVKLIPLSQTEGQKILYNLQSTFDSLLDRLKDLNDEDLFLSCPALDIASMQHEKLYFRLYMS